MFTPELDIEEDILGEAFALYSEVAASSHSKDKAALAAEFEKRWASIEKQKRFQWENKYGLRMGHKNEDILIVA
uniref:Uncharacterized protein n=1 Tax=Chromera velia CCMP2878 TaxID=1169474 RepID=A0A0G4GC73_9ALVE|eukprot:Cvel_21249.t1-p1 / transcript=Cvel_21249.t1 / gene=Cvel_21249 / organism=Chromera_velia_CCMP2878 / gene_product=hypothetical protein / transcript_product=hypothetical protein / location=Cvel_scaffold1976:30721-30939(-) / protein_length=73 / sequence_SO=supercontig / SO=protein_coding / is_pseudo=false